MDFSDPLVVNPDIELPQLDIAKNTTEDCTLEYSTGKSEKGKSVIFGFNTWTNVLYPLLLQAISLAWLWYSTFGAV